MVPYVYTTALLRLGKLSHSYDIPTGKQVIHPNQIQPAHDCFAPSEVKVKWAAELIKAFERHNQEGKVCTAGYNPCSPLHCRIVRFPALVA